MDGDNDGAKAQDAAQAGVQNGVPRRCRRR